MCDGCDRRMNGNTHAERTEETNKYIAIRLSFNVPEFSATGKLKGYSLQHMVKHGIVSEEEFGALFNFSVEALLEAIQAKAGAAEATRRKFSLTSEQAKLIEYKGVSLARHSLEGPSLSRTDPSWV